jgi:hypothetical protein
MLVIVLGTNPLLRIGHQTIVIGRIRSRPQQLLLRPRIKFKGLFSPRVEALPPFTAKLVVYIERLAPH